MFKKTIKSFNRPTYFTLLIGLVFHLTLSAQAVNAQNIFNNTITNYPSFAPSITPTYLRSGSPSPTPAISGFDDPGNSFRYAYSILGAMNLGLVQRLVFPPDDGLYGINTILKKFDSANFPQNKHFSYTLENSFFADELSYYGTHAATFLAAGTTFGVGIGLSLWGNLSSVGFAATEGLLRFIPQGYFGANGGSWNSNTNYGPWLLATVAATATTYRIATTVATVGVMAPIGAMVGGSLIIANTIYFGGPGLRAAAGITTTKREQHWAFASAMLKGGVTYGLAGGYVINMARISLSALGVIDPEISGTDIIAPHLGIAATISGLGVPSLIRMVTHGNEPADNNFTREIRWRYAASAFLRVSAISIMGAITIAYGF